MSVQLPLGLSLPQSATFAAFVSGENDLLVSLAKQMACGQSEKQLYVWGESDTGKTHLLQACCHRAAENGLTAAYLPLHELKGYGPEVLADLERLQLICIDDLHVVCGDKVWEEALFALINRIRAGQSRLVLAGTSSAQTLDITLNDLSSRVIWGPVFNLKRLSDTDKASVLQMRAAEQGLQLPDDVVNYMLNHYDRNLANLMNLLGQLDRAAMAAQRRLTIPFLRKVLEGSEQ